MKRLFRLLSVFLGSFSLAFIIASSALPKSQTNAQYVMRDYNGRVAVFRSGEASPDEVFDIFTSSLPKEEYERLMGGIAIQDDKELQKLIEAYTG
ncbi:MAG: hypothetical protein IJF40_00575 [Clostridia bacterium]|nr:hypothetical protein [Clostridia bacterium]